MPKPSRRARKTKRSLEAELRRANAFLEAILENIPDMIFVKDARELRFVRFNRAGEELLGYSRGELLGKNDYDFFPEEEADFFTATDRRVLESRRVKDIPEEPIDTRGGRRWLHTKKVGVYAPDGAPEFLLGISEDITELRRKTLELKATIEDLESFSYSVSHDLRAPLRAIDGFTDIVLREDGDVLSAEGKAALGRVREAAGRMRSLIDALLSMASLGRRPLRREPLDLTAMAESAFRAAVHPAPESRPRFTAEPGVEASGDPDLVASVLENLIGNAVKFTAGRPDAAIEFGADRSGAEPVYFVRDNGRGFDPSAAERVFQPFQRLHDPKKFPGSGIGLATVRRIVQRHGGRVRAEGAPGKGAVFYFTLPLSG